VKYKVIVADPPWSYTQNNVRFVLNVINCFKNAGPDERMYRLAEALLQERDRAQGK
jgi:hypothetical protein